jgi:hypothetical protein
MDPNCGDIALEMRSLDTQLVLTVLSDGGQDLDRPPANARARATIQYLARAIGGSARTERLAGHGLRTTISVSLEALAAVDGGEAASAGTREPDAVS